MEDEHGNGGFSWSPVGQLAAERPTVDETTGTEPLPGDEVDQELGIEPAPAEPEGGVGDAGPPGEDGSSSAEPPPLPTFDIAELDGLRVREAQEPADPWTPAPAPRTAV